jgi:hypothetical protein
MKKLITLLLGIAFVYSCSTSSDNNQNVANYNGTYIGNVNVYINNNFHSTQSKTIAISASSNSGLFLMANNIFMSTTCNINNNNLNIPRATTATSQAFNVVEYGTGTFSGNNLTIEFNQEQVNPSSQAVTGIGKWTGTLVKQ